LQFISPSVDLRNIIIDLINMSEKPYKILETSEEKGSQFSLTIEVPTETLEKFKDESVRELVATTELDGFRKGKAPEKMILETIGDMALAEKVAYKAINNLAPIVIMNEKIEAMTMPSIDITKLAVGSPLEFKMVVTKFPKIELPDYKKIAKSVPEEKATDIEEKEMDEYIDYLRKQRAQAEAMSKGEKFDAEKSELPELTNDFVKTLGKFETVEQFKEELKKNMSEEKKQKTAEARRLKIMEGIIDETKVDVPDVLIDEEVEKMMQKFKFDIEQYKMNMDDYLKQLEKTEDDLRAEWKPDATKRAKMNLILPEIAKKEKLVADAAAVEKEVAHIKEHQEDVNEQQAKMYVERVLANEAVFKFLEDQK